MIDLRTFEREARAAAGITDMAQLREAFRSAVPAAFHPDMRELARAATGITPEAEQAFAALRLGGRL